MINPPIECSFQNQLLQPVHFERFALTGCSSSYRLLAGDRNLAVALEVAFTVLCHRLHISNVVVDWWDVVIELSRRH